MLTHVKELSDTEHPQVFHVTRCSSCHGQLDLPSLHFMCKDSYHQRYVWNFNFCRCIFLFLFRCIAENETECPSCAVAHGVIRETRVKNEKLAHQHDLFVSNVQENGFEAVAVAFSRGLLTSKLDESV
jgi:hypothetical protein